MKYASLGKYLLLALVLASACDKGSGSNSTATATNTHVGGAGGTRVPGNGGASGSGGARTNTVTLTVTSTTSQTSTGTITATTTSTATTTNTATVTTTAPTTSTGTVTTTTTVTNTGTVTSIGTATATATVVTTGTATSTGTVTATGTATITGTATNTAVSGTETVTNTTTVTNTVTVNTTATLTNTGTVTSVGTATTTGTVVNTGTVTNTSTQTVTGTATNTGTMTITGTVTNTATVTSTSTQTSTAILTNTLTSSTTQTATTSGSGTSTTTSAGTSTASLGPAPSYTPPTYTPGPIPAGAQPTMADATGKWHTGVDPQTGRFSFIDPKGYVRVLRGVSMTGMESGTPGDASGGGFWMFDPKDNGTAPQIIENVVTALDQTWNPGVVRVPICGSAWATPYMVHDWSNKDIMSYRDWVDLVVKKERALGRVVIIDLHLWQIAPLSSAGKGTKRINDETGQPYTGRVDGCIGYQKLNKKDTCATTDWDQTDTHNWTCTVANAEGITLQNAHYNREKIAKMWAQIAARYKGDSGVFLELFNEPYEHVDTGAPFGSDALAADKVFPDEDKYDWDMWATVMNRWLTAVRDEGGADNVVLINGLMWGYAFHGPIANPDKYLPWVKKGVKNVAYGFHPYQHGTCCGQVGVDKDLSKEDPYHLTYCRYFKNGTTAAPTPFFSYLPSSLPREPMICGHIGYERTRSMGMPPCRWIAGAYNPNGGTGMCVGQPDVCEPLTKEQCDAMDRGSPASGGWSRYVLPMTNFGPVIATEFGSFDCSSPFVSEFMDYSDKYGVSYTAWALWPQNNGGTLNMGSCSYPSVNEAFPNLNTPYETDFKACRNLSDCVKAMGQPMRWAGHAVFENIRKHANERATN